MTVALLAYFMVRVSVVHHYLFTYFNLLFVFSTARNFYRIYGAIASYYSIEQGKRKVCKNDLLSLKFPHKFTNTELTIKA